MQSSEISEIGVSRRVRFRSFLQVPPFLHAVIFTLFRTRSAFAWESSPALTVQLQPNPVPKWVGVVDWFDYLPFATPHFPARLGTGCIVHRPSAAAEHSSAGRAGLGADHGNAFAKYKPRPGVGPGTECPVRG